MRPEVPPLISCSRIGERGMKTRSQVGGLQPYRSVKARAARSFLIRRTGSPVPGAWPALWRCGCKTGLLGGRRGSNRSKINSVEDLNLYGGRPYTAASPTSRSPPGRLPHQPAPRNRTAVQARPPLPHSCGAVEGALKKI